MKSFKIKKLNSPINSRIIFLDFSKDFCSVSLSRKALDHRGNYQCRVPFIQTLEALAFYEQLVTRTICLCAERKEECREERRLSGTLVPACFCWLTGTRGEGRFRQRGMHALHRTIERERKIDRERELSRKAKPSDSISSQVGHIGLRVLHRLRERARDGKSLRSSSSFSLSCGREKPSSRVEKQ